MLDKAQSERFLSRVEFSTGGGTEGLDRSAIPGLDQRSRKSAKRSNAGSNNRRDDRGAMGRSNATAPV